MIGVDSPTPLDLRFPLGPIPVRVGFMFWVVMALFGLDVSRMVPGDRWVNLLVWAACGFVSILAHELGHALAFRYFGSWCAITLHGFGGYAQADREPRSAWARLIVHLAGPAAGFALWGVMLGVDAGTPPRLNVYLDNAIGFLLWMNLVWSILNLFPIPPLDGGNALREVATLARARNPALIAHTVGFVLAGALAVFGGLSMAGMVPPAVYEAIPKEILPFVLPSVFRTLWMALLAIDNYQRMQLARRSYYYEPPDDDYETPPWRRR